MSEARCVRCGEPIRREEDSPAHFHGEDAVVLDAPLYIEYPGYSGKMVAAPAPPEGAK